MSSKFSNYIVLTNTSLKPSQFLHNFLQNLDVYFALLLENCLSMPEVKPVLLAICPMAFIPQFPSSFFEVFQYQSSLKVDQIFHEPL